MQTYSSNEERTEEYLKKFSCPKSLQFLISGPALTVLDVGANVGGTIREFKEFWPDAKIHAFEPQEECWGDLEAAKNAFPAGDIVINRTAVGNAFSEPHERTDRLGGCHLRQRAASEGKIAC